MRTSLLPGLADALKRNLSRGVTDAWLFEVGPDRSPRSRAATRPPSRATTPRASSPGSRAGWLKPGEPLDFFDLKSVVERSAARLRRRRRRASCRPATAPFLHPGVSARILSADGRAARQPRRDRTQRSRASWASRAAAFYFEIEVAALAGGGGARAQPRRPPRFPAISRDVSFWIDAGRRRRRPSARRSSRPPSRCCCDLAVLEDFRDPKYVPAGKKGVLWSMTYRAADRTLTDAEADEAHQACRHGAFVSTFADPDPLVRRRRLKPFDNIRRLWEHSAMTKADIVETVYEKVGGFSKKEAAEIVETVFDTIKDDPRARREDQDSPASATSWCATRIRAPDAIRRPARKSPSPRAAC